MCGSLPRPTYHYTTGILTTTTTSMPTIMQFGGRLLVRRATSVPMQMAMGLSTPGTMSLGATIVGIRTPFPERAQAMRRTYRTGRSFRNRAARLYSWAQFFSAHCHDKEGELTKPQWRTQKQAPRCAKIALAATFSASSRRSFRSPSGNIIRPPRQAKVRFHQTNVTFLSQRRPLISPGNAASILVRLETSGRHRPDKSFSIPSSPTLMAVPPSLKKTNVLPPARYH